MIFQRMKANTDKSIMIATVVDIRPLLVVITMEDIVDDVNPKRHPNNKLEKIPEYYHDYLLCIQLKEAAGFIPLLLKLLDVSLSPGRHPYRSRELR